MVENDELSLEDHLWNQSIAKSGLILLAGTLLFGGLGAYISKAREYQSFSRVNCEIKQYFSQQMEAFDRAPRGLGPYE